MKTKVIALDVYGTFLSSTDYDNEMPPRRGFLNFVKKVKDLGLILVTSSDSDLIALRLDLEETGIDPSIFDGKFQLENYPKDHRCIMEYYHIQPKELFVIGDSPEKDLYLASRLGCSTLLVPNYNREDSFNFEEINIP